MSSPADILALLAAVTIVGSAAFAITFAARANLLAWIIGMVGLVGSTVALAELQYDGRSTWVFYVIVLPILAAAVGLASFLAVLLGNYRRNQSSPN